MIVLQNRKIRISFVSLITALALYVTSSLVSSAYFFEAPYMGFYFVKYSYHDEMNKFFNDKIETMLATDLADPNSKPPSEDGECSDANVSTYCVAMKATDMFEAYINTLDKVSAHVGPYEGDTDIPMPSIIAGGNLNLSDILSITGSRDTLVAEEKVAASDILDMAIAAYNELRLAYPMHVKYKEILLKLTNFRNFLSDIRVKTAKLPGKFIDATSSSCN